VGAACQSLLMASGKTLNAENLAALGAERLAGLLLELAKGDAATKRQLRLELASRAGGDDVAAEIRKRLATIAKARSFVDWHKVRPLAKDLEAQRAAIMKHVAPTRPADALDLLWRLLEMAPSIYERCDDSNGTIGDIMSKALHNLGEVAPAANPGPEKLAERVFSGVSDNGYAQFDGLIEVMAEALGKAGLGLLKAKFEALSSAPPARVKAGERRVVAISTRGPIYEDDFARDHHVRMVRSALTDIADALGDVDGYAAHFSGSERTNPAIAADIAARLLTAGRAKEAMAALAKADPDFGKGRRWPDWEQVRIDTLEALGRSAEAQDERWAIFERDLNADYLADYLKRLPDFNDEEAESRALAHARAYAGIHQALAFLVNWPNQVMAHAVAADLILERHGELDGDHYWLLTPAADLLDQRYPLAATLMLRAMVEFALDKARSKRYGHAARHLQSCEYLSKRIDHWAGHPDHTAYLANLKLRHGRKAAFWDA
jgi:hypothetical protein